MTHFLIRLFQSDEEMSVNEASEDDERTLDEQEVHEERDENKQDAEIAALQEEAELSLDDLLSK